ncbi:MAG: hypothetical protein KAS30_01600 [Candidatus Diapherotrites archaeon]|nr:hypothetical protein [Candidatus Diapherotrites archaeon]
MNCIHGIHTSMPCTQCAEMVAQEDGNLKNMDFKEVVSLDDVAKVVSEEINNQKIHCVFCGKDAHPPFLFFRGKTICLECQRDIATAYAHEHLDPVELYVLEKKDENYKDCMHCDDGVCNICNPHNSCVKHFDENNKCKYYKEKA